MKRGGVRSQEVTDAQGRRRFHGAFTGGFSAGYYNSVGSEEGWTPRTLSSSRGNRMPQLQQRAEDFMDEEDDPLLGKRLETTERYDTLQTGAKRRLQQQQDRTGAGAGAGVGAIPGFALPDDWVLPVNDSVGAKLLKQMGWKEGHGIGQRVRKRKFQEEEKEGKEMPTQLELGNTQESTGKDARYDAEEEEVYVPPRKVFDVEKAFPKPKLDRYGAGFDPYTDAPEFSRYKQQLEEKQRAKEGSHRQVVSFSDALKATNGSNRATTGYGLSALEEDDDVDVYGTVSMAEFDRVIAPLGAKKDLKRLDSSVQEPRRYDKVTSSRTLCSDGRPVLPGFELATSKDKPPKAINLRLAVPTGFKAYHRFEEDEGRGDAVTTLYRKHNFLIDTASNGGTVVTAKQRSSLFEDHDEVDRGQVSQSDAGNGVTISGSGETLTGSVFDLLGDEQRAKLFSVAAQAKKRLPLSGVTRPALVEESPAPRAREPLVHGSGGDQFRATISASIAKRFVSAKSAGDDDKSELAAAQEPRAKVSHRSQSSWIPKSLLCKRFHVKCEGPTGSSGKGKGDDKKRNLFDEELVPHLMEFAADRAAHRQPADQANTALKPGKDDRSENTLDSELPPLPAVAKTAASLLKSIFEPSDESDVSDDDNEDDSDDELDVEERKEKRTPRSDYLTNSGMLSLDKQSGKEILKDSQGSANSAESSSSDDDEGTISPVAAISSHESVTKKRAAQRSHSIDRNDERLAQEEKRKHKKHKKHHHSKHRSSREDKEKKKKKDKKDRKERKSHKHRSSKHSRRSRSQSRDRSADRHRSSSYRHR